MAPSDHIQPSPGNFRDLLDRLEQQMGSRDGWEQVEDENSPLPFLALVDLWPDLPLAATDPGATDPGAALLKAELLGRVNNRSINAVLLRLLDGPRPQTPQPCRLQVRWADGACQAGNGEIYLVANFRNHLILTVYLRDD
ncbi:MAG: hypothetical protein ACK55H_14055 [Cyanobacteriota bacterium]